MIGFNQSRRNLFWLDKNTGKPGQPLGWIDGQKKSYDETSWLQKFTRRGAKSIWSKINRKKAQRLIASGQMKPAGLKAVEAAQRDGRWEAAHDSPAQAEVPADFQAELDQNAEAKAFFAALNSANRYAILWRIQTAKKAETRAPAHPAVYRDAGPAGEAVP